MKYQFKRSIFLVMLFFVQQCFGSTLPYDSHQIDEAFKTLGLDSQRKSTYTLRDVKVAYSKLSLQFHPDKNMTASPEVKAEAEAKFKAVGSANEIVVAYIEWREARRALSSGAASASGSGSGATPALKDTPKTEDVLALKDRPQSKEVKKESVDQAFTDLGLNPDKRSTYTLTDLATQYEKRSAMMLIDEHAAKSDAAKEEAQVNLEKLQSADSLAIKYKDSSQETSEESAINFQGMSIKNFTLTMHNLDYLVSNLSPKQVSEFTPEQTSSLTALTISYLFMNKALVDVLKVLNLNADSLLDALKYHSRVGKLSDRFLDNMNSLQMTKILNFLNDSQSSDAAVANIKSYFTDDQIKDMQERTSIPSLTNSIVKQSSVNKLPPSKIQPDVEEQSKLIHVSRVVFDMFKNNIVNFADSFAGKSKKRVLFCTSADIIAFFRAKGDAESARVVRNMNDSDKEFLLGAFNGFLWGKDLFKKGVLASDFLLISQISKLSLNADWKFFLKDAYRNAIGLAFSRYIRMTADRYITGWLDYSKLSSIEEFTLIEDLPIYDQLASNKVGETVSDAKQYMIGAFCGVLNFCLTQRLHENQTQV